MLLYLRGRKDLSEEVWHEIEIEMALANIWHFDEASRLIVGGGILAHQRSNGVVVRQKRDKNTARARLPASTF